jgi:hypothetical protein
MSSAQGSVAAALINNTIIPYCCRVCKKVHIPDAPANPPRSFYNKGMHASPKPLSK